MTSTAHLTIQHQGSSTIITFSGEMDSVSVPPMRERLEKEIHETDNSFILDITDVQFIDSHAVGLFVSILKKAHSRHGKMAFCGAQEQPASVLKMVGFNCGLVEYFNNIDECRPSKEASAGA